jgi:hypothetical protein
MIILLPTVKHTGTYFCLKQLLKGFAPVPLKTARKDIKLLSGDMVIFDHLYPHKMNAWLDMLKKYPAIIPLRNKHSVMESWMSRGEDIEDFHKQWTQLKRMIGKRTYFLSIDAPELRDHQLERIKNELNVDIDPGNWEVVRK